MDEEVDEKIEGKGYAILINKYTSLSLGEKSKIKLDKTMEMIRDYLWTKTDYNKEPFPPYKCDIEGVKKVKDKDWELALNMVTEEKKWIKVGNYMPMKEVRAFVGYLVFLGYGEREIIEEFLWRRMKRWLIEDEGEKEEGIRGWRKGKE